MKSFGYYKVLCPKNCKYLSIVLWFAFKDDFLTLLTINYMKWVKQMIASWLDKYKNRGTDISDDSLKILYKNIL